MTLEDRQTLQAKKSWGIWTIHLPGWISCLKCITRLASFPRFQKFDVNVSPDGRKRVLTSVRPLRVVSLAGRLQDLSESAMQPRDGSAISAKRVKSRQNRQNQHKKDAPAVG